MDRRDFLRGLALASTGPPFLPIMAGCKSRPQPPGAGLSSVRAALLAPLSGPLSAEGLQMAQAARLAAETEPGSTLIVEDTSESPASASRAADRALKKGAQAFAGPLFSQQAWAVWYASGGRVPVFSLSNDPALLNTGIHLMGVTPDESVSAILRYAASRGVRRVAVLGDGAEWSRQCASAVAAFAGPLGLEPGPILQASQAEAGRACAHIARAGPDAVLVPPGGDALARLAPHLGALSAQLLGTHKWTKAAEDGAAPAGGWYCCLDPQAGGMFADRFLLANGAAPGLLAALAHDAVLAAFRRSPGRAVAGATGQLRFAPDGGARRGLAIAVASQTGSRVLAGTSVS